MKLLKSMLALCTAALFSAPTLAASVDGLAIRSTVQGEGKTIVFVHGWTCDDSSWDGQVPDFMHDYRVVTLDLPGHGASDSPATADDYSIDQFAAAVEAVRAELGADKIVLVGHSMGAGVIRTYALNYPEHVAGLVAVDGLLDARPWTKSGMRGQPMTIERRKAAIEGMFVDGTSEPLREKILTMMLDSSEQTASGAANAMVAPEIQSDELIMAPALTVWAATREVDPEYSTKDMVPNWEDVRLEGTGHFLMMEKPAEFNALLRQFIEQRAEF
jgi:pimeloyl-ACP methyl ester carboxylesterase